jgi:hypothetical protein
VGALCRGSRTAADQLESRPGPRECRHKDPRSEAAWTNQADSDGGCYSR